MGLCYWSLYLCLNWLVGMEEFLLFHPKFGLFLHEVRAGEKGDGIIWAWARHRNGLS